MELKAFEVVASLSGSYLDKYNEIKNRHHNIVSLILNHINTLYFKDAHAFMELLCEIAGVKFEREEPQPDKDLILSSSFKGNLKSMSGKIAAILRSQHPKFKRWVTSEDINYLTVKTGIISYLPEGKPLLLNDSGEWRKEGRQDAKPSKAIRKVLTPYALSHLKDKDFEVFTNELKACYGDYSFKILEDEELVRVYTDASELIVNSSTLGASCMNDEPSGYFQLYYDHAKMLVAYDHNKMVVGRALIWKARLNNGDIVTYMDRVYYAKEELKPLYKSYAKEQGWYSKLLQSMDDPTSWVSPDGDEVDVCAVVDGVSYNDYEDFPYLDTFRWGIDGDFSNNEQGVAERVFDSTGGEYSSMGVYVDRHNEYFPEEDCVYTVDGDWELEEDCVIIDGDWYLKDSSDVVVDVDGDYQLYKNCEEVDGDWYLSDDDRVVITYQGEVRLKEDCVIIDGDWYDRDECVEIEGVWWLAKDCELVDGDYKPLNY